MKKKKLKLVSFFLIFSANLFAASGSTSDYPLLCECSEWVIKALNSNIDPSKTIENVVCSKHRCVNKAETCIYHGNRALKQMKEENRSVVVDFAHLKPGDWVLSDYSNTGEQVFSPVTYVSHNGTEHTNFVNITTKLGSVLVTQYHRVFVGDLESTYDLQAEDVFNKVSCGEKLNLISKGIQIPIEGVTHSKSDGYISPITEIGTVVVASPDMGDQAEKFQGVVMSCYALLKHKWMHQIMKPHRWLVGGKTRQGYEEGSWWENMLEKIAYRLNT